MQTVDHKKNIIEVENLSFSYGNEEILKNITLNIHTGDYVGLVGPNGAGKTTLLKIMLGILKPKTGNVKLFGRDLSEFSEWADIGYVPQKVTNFDSRFPATVYEVVRMGRFGKKGLFRGMSRDDNVRVEEALKHVGMWEYKDRLIGELSGGQQQKVFIARALAIDPKIIFLDEPTTGIDAKSQSDFYELLGKLNRDLGLTLVLVSHDITAITREAMHIICIDRTLVCYTTPQEFAKDIKSNFVEGHNINIIEHHHN